MFEEILAKLQQLDMLSLGMGVILTVLAFAVFRMGMWRINKKKAKDE